jgi:hypothetical protein
MKITKEKVEGVIKKHFPQLKVNITVNEEREGFISFVALNTIECPPKIFNKMEGYTANISFVARIFHEMGHIATTKENINSLSELVEAEGNAQKWAIEKAIELKQQNVAKCLLEEFELWGYGKEDSEGSDGSYSFYQEGDPYQRANEANEEWISEKFEIVF